MATATSLSEQLLDLKEDMGWSWSEMANQVEGALNVKGPSGSTLFRYAKGQANPSDLVEQTVLKAIQTIREKQLAEAEANNAIDESSNVSDREVSELAVVEAEAETEAAEVEVAEEVEEQVETAEVVEATEDHIDEVVEDVVEEAVVETPIPYDIHWASLNDDVPFGYGISHLIEYLSANEVVEVEEIAPSYPVLSESTPFGLGIPTNFDEVEVNEEEAHVAYPELNGATAHGAGIPADEILNEDITYAPRAIEWAALETEVSFAYGISLTPVADVVEEADVEAEEAELQVEEPEVAEVDEQVIEEAAVEEPEMADINEEIVESSIDIDEDTLVEHYEMMAVEEAQVAFEHDIDHEESIEESAHVEEVAEIEEEVVEVADLSETDVVEEVSNENLSETESESIDELVEISEALYDTPAQIHDFFPTTYHIFDEHLVGSDEIPTMAELGVHESVHVEQPIASANTDEELVVRELAQFGEGSLYANGHAEITYDNCPKAPEFMARSREIVYSAPEVEEEI